MAGVTSLDRFKRLATRLITGLRLILMEERLRRLGLYSLQRRLVWAARIIAFNIFTGLLDMEPSLLFLTPIRGALRKHSYKAFKVKTIADGENWPFWRGPWTNRLTSGFNCYAPFYWDFQEMVGSNVDRGLSPSPQVKPLLTEHTFIQFPTLSLYLHHTH